MQYKILGSTMPVVEVMLNKGESMFTQSGGMAWMDKGIRMDTNTKGGLLKGIGRMFTGESLFMATYTADMDQSKIAFATTFVGKILPINLSENGPFICQKDAFLCGEFSVNLNVVFTKRFSSGLFGGEGFILQKISGSGMAFLETSGDIVEKNLEQGEEILVDTGHVIAFQEGVRYEVEIVKGVKNIVFGGEGLFLTRLTGPGKVMLQTMTVSGVAERIMPYIPGKS